MAMTDTQNHSIELSRELQKRSMLGFFAHPGTLAEYLELTRQSVTQSKRTTVLYHNLHSLYSYFTDDNLRKHYQGTTVLVDGMPLIWLMKLLRIPVTRDHRITYVDFIMPLMELARDNNWPVFHVGQQSAVQQRALEIVREKVTGIDISGHDGYFNQEAQHPESLKVIEQMNSNKSAIVLVGFGAPKQEAWLHHHRHLIEAPIVFSCGACMEYVAGAVKTPPRWMGRVGLEWSFRLLENPKRFAFRYLAEPILLGFILLRNGFKDLLSGKSSNS